MNKKTYVEQRLIYVVKALFPRVGTLIYKHYSEPNNPECEAVYADVIPANGISSSRNTIKINVSGDSLIALTRDVLKKLEEKL